MFFHADFENKLNFVPKYNAKQDIAVTVNCFRNTSQIEIQA